MKKVTALQELRNENSPHNSCITYQEYVEQYNYWVDWINKKNGSVPKSVSGTAIFSKGVNSL